MKEMAGWQWVLRRERGGVARRTEWPGMEGWVGREQEPVGHQMGWPCRWPGLGQIGW